MANLEQIMNDLSALTVVEAAALVKQLEEKWGVKAATGGGMMMMPAGGAAAEKAPEKTEFDVILANSGADKIKVIKEVRAITGLGLKEAKDLVDGAPKPIKEGVTKEEAAEIKAKVESAGGKVKVD
jgi:large subunit ribosomal protein L7/L12